ncbi:hypothetical protein [Streptomyces sp. KM273126]|nr:hypothetical protein [Streptomyces sp. KM273126]
MTMADAGRGIRRACAMVPLPVLVPHASLSQPDQLDEPTEDPTP